MKLRPFWKGYGYKDYMREYGVLETWVFSERKNVQFIPKIGNVFPFYGIPSKYKWMEALPFVKDNSSRWLKFKP